MSSDGLEVGESVRGSALAFAASVIREHSEFWADERELFRLALEVQRMMRELMERVEARAGEVD